MTDNFNMQFMLRAIELAETGMQNDMGGPFGAVVVQHGKIVGESYNQVTSTNDPTAHAEVMAIRNACKALNSFQLDNCQLYTSCEPCPMCLGAIYWARPEEVYFACTRADAAAIDFDDHHIYNEIDKPFNERTIPMYQTMRRVAMHVFEKWQQKNNRIKY